MFRVKYLSIFALLIQNIACDFKCEPNVAPCVCYSPTSNTAETSQLVCTDTTGILDATNLERIGKLISGDGYLLHIYNATNLTDINVNTFGKVTFKKIFIEENPELTSIDKSAFKSSTRTETLAVRNNPLLKRSDLFEVAAAVGHDLTNVEFQGNNIDSFDNAFNKDIFSKVSDIRLDSQHVNQIIKLKKDSFAKLPKLEHLSLNNNKFAIVDQNSRVIDLSSTVSHHVSIFLSTGELTSVDGLLSKPKFSVGLDLENNKLEGIPIICRDIADNSGTCFLNKAVSSCNCTVDFWVNGFASINNIRGITDLKCDNKETLITECEVPESTTTTTVKSF